MSFRVLGPSRDWSASYMTLQKSCSAKVGAWPSFCRLRANMKSKFALSSPRSLGVCRLLFLSCLSCSSTEGGKKNNNQYLRNVRYAAIPQFKSRPSKYSRFSGICAGTREAQPYSAHRNPNIETAMIKGSVIILIVLLVSNMNEL